MRRFSLLALALMLIVGSGCNDQQGESTIEEVLRNGQSFELISIEPSWWEEPPEGAEMFHGNQVLGTMQVSDPATRDRIVSALLEGISEDATAYDCFDPRHGIRVEYRGVTHEFSICFECGQIYWYGQGDSQRLLVFGSPAKTFNQMLREANIPLAKN